MSQTPAHWIRPNEQNRYPRLIVCMDSEAVRHTTPNGERHTFRLASASFDVVNPTVMAPERTEVKDFDNPADLWLWIDGKTRKNWRTVLWCHNLGYDLRLTQALLILPHLGWHYRAGSFAPRATWAIWKRENRTLQMVDLYSFLPRSLERLGREIGMEKTDLPNTASSLEDWRERCATDVAITREVVLDLMRWLEETDLGSFRLTGAAQGSAAFRHRFMRRRSVLCHSDDTAKEAERRSCWTGRCEVWKHGPTMQEVHEWDYSLAYATIARDALLPSQLVSTREKIGPSEFKTLARGFRVLAEVEVETEQPTIPTEMDGRILWPVGRFTSTIWDDEIRLAYDEGATIKFGKAWIYKARPILKDWAEWIIENLEGDTPEKNPLARILLKSWSRSLIGRFGLRYPQWQDFATSEISDLFYSPYLDSDTRGHGVMFQIGTDVLEQAELTEASDSAPAIMAAIMSAARVRLWRTMKEVGLDRVIYCDTDSLLLDVNGSLVAQRIAHRFPGLRLKSKYMGGDFRAPRNMILQSDARIAGIPKSASDNGGGRFTGEVWQGITESIRSRSAGEVRVIRRSFDSTIAEDFRRYHLEDGTTLPYRVGC